MGLDIERTSFEPHEFARFCDRLIDSIDVLRELVQRPDFGLGEPSVGAELELHLVDREARPAPRNEEVLHRARDPRVTLEINRFNLELNASPVRLRGRPFTAMERELSAACAVLSSAADRVQARIAMIGILPTLERSDLCGEALTDRARYHALSNALRHLRGAPFEVRIDGEDRLRMSCDDVTLEGANTSFQVHLKVAPSAFAAHYNASQIAAAPVLAAAGNSPLFVGHRLWEETRIALFKQAVDTRTELNGSWHPPPRVCFGHGFIADPVVPFAHSVALHVPLLPVLAEEDPREALHAGRVPQLSELRLHHGTVWSWNRAIFDPIRGGHLRIEHRVLPSGPTIVDMLANAAFTVGLSLGLAPDIERIMPAFPFEHAQYNFYRAAKNGLRAELLWPSERAPSPRPCAAHELVLSLLPVAARGLAHAGVASSDYEPLLDVLQARVASGRTGSRVFCEWLEHDERNLPRTRALAVTLERYLAHAASGAPVHTWPRLH